MKHKNGKTNERLILYPSLILSVDNLKRSIMLTINTTSTKSQLNGKYFEISKPTIVFTITNNEPNNKIILVIIYKVGGIGGD
jgi:ssRNA-specific RNase YbeY (16S rRNA maturation enzyme)